MSRTNMPSPTHPPPLWVLRALTLTLDLSHFSTRLQLFSTSRRRLTCEALLASMKRRSCPRPPNRVHLSDVGHPEPRGVHRKLHWSIVNATEWDAVSRSTLFIQPDMLKTSIISSGLRKRLDWSLYTWSPTSLEGMMDYLQHCTYQASVSATVEGAQPPIQRFQTHGRDVACYGRC